MMCLSLSSKRRDEKKVFKIYLQKEQVNHTEEIKGYLAMSR